MKKEYDFSKGVRGKFYHKNLQLNLPIYLDADVRVFVQEYARKTKKDAQSVVNKIIRSNRKKLNMAG